MSEPQIEHPAVNALRPLTPVEPLRSIGAAEPRVPSQYERLLSTLARAERELAVEDSAGRGTALEEASGIVFELLYALDFRKGGELAPRLAALYGYIGNELLNVGRTGDRVQLAHLRDMITTLRQAWGEAA
jgi:flagellar secretion chaperone FliS